MARVRLSSAPNSVPHTRSINSTRVKTRPGSPVSTHSTCMILGSTLTSPSGPAIMLRSGVTSLSRSRKGAEIWTMEFLPRVRRCKISRPTRPGRQGPTGCFASQITDLRKKSEFLQHRLGTRAPLWPVNGAAFDAGNRDERGFAETGPGRVGGRSGGGGGGHYFSRWRAEESTEYAAISRQCPDREGG